MGRVLKNKYWKQKEQSQRGIDMLKPAVYFFLLSYFFTLTHSQCAILQDPQDPNKVYDINGLGLAGDFKGSFYFNFNIILFILFIPPFWMY